MLLRNLRTPVFSAMNSQEVNSLVLRERHRDLVCKLPSEKAEKNEYHSKAKAADKDTRGDQ